MSRRAKGNWTQGVQASVTTVLLCLSPIFWSCGATHPGETRSIKTMKTVAELPGVWHTVKAGERVQDIARRYSVPIEDVIELNGLEASTDLTVGQPIFVFGVRKRSESRARKKRRAPKRTSGVPSLKWPVVGGVFTSGFGPRGRRMHRGIDLAAKPGTPIFAVADGVVVYSDNKQRGYGNLVIIDHGKGVLTVYAHNRRNLVDEGERVRQGARIAEVGNTGRSTGPHLHFELRVKGKAVNPLDYLPAK